MGNQKKGPPIVHLKLTLKQEGAIEKLRDAAFSAYVDGQPGMILGQICNGKIRAGFVSNEKALKVLEILHGKKVPVKPISDVSECGDNVIAKG